MSAELGQRELRPDQHMFLGCVEAMLAALTGDPVQAASLLEQHADQMDATEFVAARDDLSGSQVRCEPRGR